MTNPYDSKSAMAFWRSAVAERNPLEINNLWNPCFPISRTDKVVTAGSCFAQHIGRALKANGFNWFNAEPAPRLMREEDAKDLNYGIFSFRTGNIYTTALLLQWVAWAAGEQNVSEEIWEAKGRYFDPFRPVVEPNGFASVAELKASQRGTIEAVRRAIGESNIFVFTLGLTEGWSSRVTGVQYPMCPGTAAGTFDSAQHVFNNFAYPETRDNLERAIALMRSLNPALRVLLTVSPVPLTATATDDHVLVATTYSKSTLRAVAGDLARKYDFIDYFPSYEIITSSPYRGIFFEPNMRSVSAEGVAFVMRNFFGSFHAEPLPETIESAAEQPGKRHSAISRAKRLDERDADEVACEDELLEAFGPAA